MTPSSCSLTGSLELHRAKDARQSVVKMLWNHVGAAFLVKRLISERWANPFVQSDMW